MPWFTPPNADHPPASTPPATAPQLVPPPCVGPDPRTLPGVLITNGRHVWEITGPRTKDGDYPAVNQLTGYTINLTPDTIGTCWPLLPDSEFALLT